MTHADTIQSIQAMLISLKESRINSGLTLREVEEKTGISNAYLSQLETGKITKPSWDVVRKLFELYFDVKHPKIQLVKSKS